MTPTRFILRSLAHYRFAYLGVFAGAVLGATVLLGALFAGDSVNTSLQRIAGFRTGRATHVLTAGDRSFRATLATDLASAAKIRTAPVFFARGTATHGGTRAAAGQVQLVGVTNAFWQFAPTPSAVTLDPAKSAVAVNDTLARRLGVAAGDTLVIRLQKPGILGGNAPVAGAEASLQTVRCTIATIVDDASFGRFSLETTQIASPTIFLPMALLQEALEQRERANLLLLDATASSADLKGALNQAVRLADYGLTLKWLELAGVFELTSNRIFIDPPLAEALAGAVPSAQPVVSYLVNEFRLGERATPYSIATATTPPAAPFLPPDLGPRDIALNAWLAEDLQAKAGDEVKVTYFGTAASGQLVEQSANFRVHAIVPLEGLAADRAWMPEFPGITDTQNQSDWDPGLPLDLKRIRDKDERYWDEHRGAPKAFLPLAAGREIWSTRWGNTTALRIPFERGRASELEATLLRALRPEMNQLLLREFAASAAGAAQSPVDFAGLFIGMSFFLIIAALGLVAMLFQLSLLQRNREDALLSAVGVSGRTLLRWRLGEATVLLLVAGAAGLGLATIYTRAILRFLETIWAAPGAAATFVFAAQPTSIAIGGSAFLMLSLGAIWLAIRKQARRALSIRLAAHTEETIPAAKSGRFSIVAAIIAAVIAVMALALSGRGLPAQAAFYLAGFALLAAGILLCRAWLSRKQTPQLDARLDAARLGQLNLRARRTRSLTVVGLIATAVFMVLSVASFRKHVGADWLNRGSGTGGFAFWIETTSALNVAREVGPAGFDIFEPHKAALGEIIPLRAGDGDNANCFNLNSTARPRLLAVDAAELAARKAFRVKLWQPTAASGWSALQRKDGPIPAFVDETTLLWALKRKLGDVLNYTDEHGRPFDIQIVGALPDSIFQGHVIVDEQRFLQKYPSNPGYSAFLADARDPGNLSDLRTRLESSARDAGARVELTRDVLAAFHEIENTYIAIFNVLGSLGVILGSLGLAIVVARNLRERRGEFGVMTAIGIPRAVLARMVSTEFGRLVIWGIAVGGIASLVAVGPNLAGLPPGPTLGLVLALLLGIVALNLASGWLIFRWSLRDLRPGVEQPAA